MDALVLWQQPAIGTQYCILLTRRQEAGASQMTRSGCLHSTVHKHDNAPCMSLVTQSAKGLSSLSLRVVYLQDLLQLACNCTKLLGNMAIASWCCVCLKVSTHSRLRSASAARATLSKAPTTRGGRCLGEGFPCFSLPPWCHCHLALWPMRAAHGVTSDGNRIRSVCIAL